MSETFEIKQGVCPPKAQYRGKYPFQRLKVNEYFVVPCEPFEQEYMAKSLWSSARWATYKTGFKFATRKVEGGIAIWRIW
jgi:hypothetical protein